MTKLEWISRALGSAINAFFDEFQDNDPIKIEIAVLIASTIRTLVWEGRSDDRHRTRPTSCVGDPPSLSILPISAERTSGVHEGKRDELVGSSNEQLEQNSGPDARSSSWG